MRTITCDSREEESVSSQRHVQGHHDDEAQDGAPAGQTTVALGLTLGHNIVHDHVDHGPGGEGEGVGEDGDYPGDKGSPKHSCHWLHQSGQLTIPGTML